jgi:aspartyl/asparaginyl beta-hydroxylase (cupin superfamily)
MLVKLESASLGGAHRGEIEPMASVADQAGQLSLLDRFRKRRRRTVKRLGKRLMAVMSDVIARQSLVGDAPVLDNRHFPYIEPLAADWQAIRDEVREILKHREAVPAFQEVSTDQKRIAKDTNWRTFILYGFGVKAEKNCRQAPVTCALLEQIPNLQTAWFSILAPGYHIPAHRGVSKGIIRGHLGLIIPGEREKCRLRVDEEICVWREGEVFVFDDTFEHEVWNDTDEERVILLFDFDRPMRPLGRLLNNSFLGLLRLTSFYREPMRRIHSLEDRFEAAVRQADAALEALSEADA